MAKENKYLDYGRLEFTVGAVAKAKENDTIFAVYCDESIEGEFPHDKLVAIFKTREEAQECANVQNTLHLISQGHYYTFRVEEISTLSRPKGVEDYQAETTFYFFEVPHYDGKKFHSYTRIIEKTAHHNDRDVVFEKGDSFYESKWNVTVFLDLNKMSTREEVLKDSMELANDYLIRKGLISVSEPFE